MHARQNYLHICRLAQGGMGYVELVMRREGSFSRLYALKRILPEFREDPPFRSMVLEEARLAGLVRHPNVVSVLDVGEDKEGPFLLMDYVEGVPVTRLIQDAGGLLPLSVCLEVGVQIASGLAAAHELKNLEGEPLELVHRDVSPQNILLGFDGVARLADFGIAKALGHQSESTTDVLKGKTGYMSPEALKFLSLDHRADLFSFGVVLFELLAGKRLYSSEEGMSAAHRVLYEAPPDIGDRRSDVPPEIVDLLLGLLSKDPKDRPESARAVLKVLEASQRSLAQSLGDSEWISLRAYMDSEFGAVRDAEHGRIKDLVAQASTEQSAALFFSDPPPKGSGFSRRAVPVAVAAVAVALGLFLWSLRGPAVPDEPRPTSAQRDQAPPVPAVQPPTTVALPDAGVVPSVEEASANPTEPARRPARRRPRHRDTATKNPSTAPRPWGWRGTTP